MVSFQFEAAVNVGLTADLTSMISGNRITVQIPSADLNAFHSLIPSFTADHGGLTAEVAVNGAVQVSGTTALDFTAPVFYEITDSAGAKQLYKVEFKSRDLSYIPDSTFRTYLKSLTELSSAFDEDWLKTNDSGLANVRRIFAILEFTFSGHVASFQGVQYFPNLEEFKFSQNDGRDSVRLVDISKNIRLSELELENLDLTSIDLSKNIQLTKIGLGGNKLTDIDLSKNVAGLINLDLRDNNELKTADIRSFGMFFSGGAIGLGLVVLPALTLLKVNEKVKDHAALKELKRVRGNDLTIEVYRSSLVDGGQIDIDSYTLVDEDYTPS